MNPKVTVIVPNYNHEKFLKQRIDSIFDQTFQDFEVILLDDCSTDESVGILRERASHSKVSHLIVNKANSGSPFKQWKGGIKMARGQYLWLAESDDWAEVAFLQQMVAILDQNDRLGIAYVQSYVASSTGEIMNTYNYETLGFQPQRWQRNYVNSGGDEIDNFLSRRNTIPNASAVLIRACAIPEDLQFLDEYKLLGDWRLWIEILDNYDIAYKSEALNYFRRSENNSRLHVSKEKKVLRIIEEVSIKRTLKNKKYLNELEYGDKIRQSLFKIRKILGSRRMFFFWLKYFTFFSKADFLCLLKAYGK